MDHTIKDIYSDLDRLRKLNKVLSDKSFYEQRGYFIDDIPDFLLELSFPIRNPLSFLDNDNGYVLDIGCGSGLDIYLIKKHYKNKKVIGIDISFPLLLEAKNVSNKLVCSSAIELPFKNGIFSMVIMNGVFNLIDDKKKLLGEVNRVLSNKGIFFVADIYKRCDFYISREADLFNLGKSMKLDDLFEIFRSSGFQYEFGEYEKEIIHEIGIFTIKWSKNE